ncbi:glutamate receptor ionotropic, kainate 5 [Chelonus insularis]|uniref:glutamate receptor ionotropic, kainate 5 n=1 Tax=Chelonus insularis TaxID=460826 RepID=UPI00158E528B|nr:glutamate receptor ionotropic, kainate 5 [Chelonus insularis]
MIDKWPEKFEEPLNNMINSVIEEISRRSNCIVFIIDPFYNRLLQYYWMSKKLTSYFTINLRENEEFNPPKQKINRTLIASKNSACDAYVILISNGCQVNELLQYAESERLLNTQSLFLLIHDTRLFTAEMKYLWNRITKSIFIRIFNNLNVRLGERMNNEWFNLETIRYPLYSDSSIITYYVNTWYKGKFRYEKKNLFKKLNSFKDLQNQKLKVAIFEHIPAVTKYSRMFYERYHHSANKALGIEFEIIRLLSQKLNFKPIYYRPSDIETSKWGTPDGNGSYNGLLGEAVEAKAAFLLGDFYYTLQHYRLLELSYPYNTECLTFLTPEALTENSWKLLIVPLKLYSWIAIILILFLVAFTFRLFAVFYQNQIMPFKLYENQDSNNLKVVNKEKSLIGVNNKVKGLALFTDMQNSLLYTHSTLLQVSLPKLPEIWALRVFIGWWWLYCILVTVIYRASLTASLANPIGRVTIDTFTELARSSITVGSWGENKKEPFILSSDIELNKIGERFEIINNEEDAVARVANGTFGYYESVYVLKEARAKRQLLNAMEKKKAIEQNQNLIIDRDLHIMKECVIHMPISIGMDKNSPLKPVVDEIIRNIIENGLVEKWLSDVMEWSKIAEIKTENVAPKALMDLKKLYGALIVLGVGCFVGLTTLLIENLHWKYIVVKNPEFDKYQMDLFYKKIKQKK